MKTKPEIMRDALQGVLALIDDQVLVRNIENDHNMMTFLTQGMRITKTLKAAQDALASANDKMKPRQERVVTEKTELDAKREKLAAFIGGDVYRTMDKTEQSRLNRQLEAMTLYATILGERIAAFAP